MSDKNELSRPARYWSIMEKARRKAYEREAAEIYIAKLKRREEGALPPGAVSPNYPVFFVRGSCGTTFDCTNSKPNAFVHLKSLPLGVGAVVYERKGSALILAEP